RPPRVAPNRRISRCHIGDKHFRGGPRLEPALTLSFEDPADFLDVITPARVRLLQGIDRRAAAIFALAAALARDPSAVRRDVALLESKHLVRTRKVPNPGRGTRTLVERGRCFH